ncbi:hypothetical protein C366_06652 [Cryptococcus neoformans Tu401-1]|nr:hypothetical protein C366_06652 [Cryptococcus neoformans var. grubii Tu401-1]
MDRAGNENKLLELVGFIKDRFIKTKNLLSAKMILYKFRTMAMSVRRN